MNRYILIHDETGFGVLDTVTNLVAHFGPRSFAEVGLKFMNTGDSSGFRFSEQTLPFTVVEEGVPA